MPNGGVREIEQTADRDGVEYNGAGNEYDYGGVALSTCFHTYFYQFNIFLHLGDENALSMMETLKLPNSFFALSKATVDVHQF